MRDSKRANVPEMSVSEVSLGIKNRLESAFGAVRVRGELGRVSRPASGHVYADLKDDGAVLSLVLWKSAAHTLTFVPEEGLEVVAEGRISAYKSRSAYQLIADIMRPTGIGALMKVLDDRRQKLDAEGIFDSCHKKPLPIFPRTIGVVTSPTGAAIEDILHRMPERFACRVLIWPSLVQGPEAAGQIAAGINGLNAMKDLPDVIIVARGGGSVEDLWAFNEEIVVRAAFASSIPLISAVGHETDTTLIDHVADVRAPTPTAAVELALPFTRKSTVYRLAETYERMRRVTRIRIESEAARLAAERLPQDILRQPRKRFESAVHALEAHIRADQHRRHQAVTHAGARLAPHILREGVRRRRERVTGASRLMQSALARMMNERVQAVESLTRVMHSVSHSRTLQRGYALISDEVGRILTRTGDISKGQPVRIGLADGEVAAVVVSVKRRRQDAPGGPS